MNPTALLLSSIVAVDALAFALVLPLLPVILEQQHTPTAMVVLIFAAFSVCQFFAAPVLGRLADRFGRRQVLLLSQVGTFVGFLILAASQGRVEWILASRIIDGFTAGNLAVVFAVVCDLWADEERASAFSRINGAGAFGFVAGMAGAAWLAHESLATLALIAAAAAGVTIVLGLVTPFPPQGPAVPHLALRAAYTQHAWLRRPFVLVVMGQLVMTALMSAGALLLHTRGGLSASVSLLVLLAGLVLGAVVQGAGSALVERRVGMVGVLRLGLIGVVLGTGALWFALPTGNPWVIGVPVVVLSGAVLLVVSGAVAWLSSSSTLGAGLTMGLSQSGAALGQLLGPALALACLGVGAWVFHLLLIGVAVAGVGVLLDRSRSVVASR